MWLPAVGRLVATRTVDRGFQPPMPLRNWGSPKPLVIIIPLATILTIYSIAYGVAALIGVEQEQPRWVGPKQIAINMVITGVIHGTLTLFGALGEELGWRGYMLPRLDQLGVRGSLGIVALVWTIYHIPLIIAGGYVFTGSFAISVLLFFLLIIGSNLVWSIGTYALRSIWVAVWLHTFHNTISQALLPKILGEGDPSILGESGLLPGGVYLIAAALCWAWIRRKYGSWAAFARTAVGPEQARRPVQPVEDIEPH
jgi:membrane protease YdiL (CAAX protease family)